MLPLDLYNSIEPAWCPGCGNFPMLKAFKKALAELDIRPENILVIPGIGQSSKFPHYLRCNTFNGIDGRALPVATGARLANPNLKVVVTAGDGDQLRRRGQSSPGRVRRNPDLTLVIHNNQIYALTKGQASPTTDQGTKHLPGRFVDPWAVRSPKGEEMHHGPQAEKDRVDCSGPREGSAREVPWQGGPGDRSAGEVLEAVTWHPQLATDADDRESRPTAGRQELRASSVRRRAADAQHPRRLFDPQEVRDLVCPCHRPSPPHRNPPRAERRTRRDGCADRGRAHPTDTEGRRRRREHPSRRRPGNGRP